MDSLSLHDSTHHSPPHVGPSKVRLQDVKAQLGITSKALAQRAGVSASTITNCERGMGILIPKATNILDALNAFREEGGFRSLSLREIDWNVRENRHTPEGRARMSEQRRGERNAMYGRVGANKGKKFSEEHKQRIGAGNEGKVVTPETRKKISIARTGTKQSAEHALKSATVGLGKVRSPEAKQRYSVAKKLQWSSLSPEERSERAINWTRAGQASSPLMQKDTKPERIFEAKLQAQGLLLGRDYEKQFEIGSCHADFYLVYDNLVVEILGCWWHQCEQCGHTQGVKSKKGLLRTVEQVHARDARRMAYIQSKGYAIQVIWAHEL